MWTPLIRYICTKSHEKVQWRFHVSAKCATQHTFGDVSNLLNNQCIPRWQIYLRQALVHYNYTTWAPRSLNSDRLTVPQYFYAHTSDHWIISHFLGESIHRWIPITNGQWCGERFHATTPSNQVHQKIQQLCWWAMESNMKGSSYLRGWSWSGGSYGNNIRVISCPNCALGITSVLLP